VRSTIETQPRELAATITAFAARCVNANATEAYTECANKLGIRGDQSPEAVYKAMRRLVTTLRRPEFHGELRFLAEPGIDVDLLIKTVLEPNFRELS
jgi:alcohol dehydrogenase class IV